VKYDLFFNWNFNFISCYCDCFDFKTITAEEWKAWIYRYHKNPEKLKKEEEEGYFI